MEASAAAPTSVFGSPVTARRARNDSTVISSTERRSSGSWSSRAPPQRAECQISWKHLSVVKLLEGLDLPQSDESTDRGGDTHIHVGDFVQQNVTNSGAGGSIVGQQVEPPAVPTRAVPPELHRPEKPTVGRGSRAVSGLSPPFSPRCFLCQPSAGDLG